jgi:cephalosporin-C deacetylase-like acetyl esterase
MTRRQLFRLASAGASAAALHAAPRSYPGVAYRHYSRCLPDYLRTLAARAYEHRNRQIARLTSPGAVEERQKWIRETFWQLSGGMPERTPLNPRTLGVLERPGYRLEKLVYESRPGLFVSANLYVPAQGKPPFPGVLFQMGHALEGKAAPAYQKCCQGLVRLGFLVLAFDPMGQGERIYYPDRTGYRTRLDSADDEHTLPGKQMLLIGDTATRFQVWDAVRSLDYLASHPLVDPSRLASTGNSGGGTLTMLLAAVDDRLAAAAASCPNTENLACADFNPPGSTDDAEQNLIGAAPLGLDRWDLFYPFAPKPLLILVSARDFFGTYSPNYIANGWEEFEKLAGIYRLLGHSERIAWRDTPLPHGLEYGMRMEIYNWLARWLQGRTEPVAAEPAVEVEPERALWVTPEGSLVRHFRSETPFTLTRGRAAAIRTPEKPADLGALLGVDLPARELQARVLGRAASLRADVEVIEVASAEHVWLPAWVFLPRASDPSHPVLLALEPAGRTAGWREEELYPTLASRGLLVVVPDLRGLGDLRPEFPRYAPQHARSHQQEEAFAWASLMLGKPLLGQRVTDILAVAQALRSLPATRNRRLLVAARGTLAAPALFAACLEPAIERVYLAGGLVSYRSIVEAEEYREPLANFVFGLLLETDLPQVARTLAPRRVILAGATDAAGRTLELPEVRRIWDRAGNVEIRAAAAWDVETLSALG